MKLDETDMIKYTVYQLKSFAESYVPPRGGGVVDYDENGNEFGRSVLRVIKM